MAMNIFQAAKQTISDALSVCVDLFRIMIPIVVLVKILNEFELIKYLAIPLEPVMQLVGLPARTGLIWATAIANNLYAGIWVYLALLPDMPHLTVAQITTLTCMMLVAHNLLVETRIAQKCGTSMWGQVSIRLGGGFLFGLVLHGFFSSMGLLDYPSTILWATQPPGATLLEWIWGQVANLTSLVVIITAVMALMRILKFLKIIDLLNRMLRPVLQIIGVGSQAATVTIIGLVVGIAYGGGIIIHEARAGRLSRADVFSSMTLMGFSHGLIEDSLIMVLIGADIYTILLGRLLFSLVCVSIVVRLYHWRMKGHKERSAAG